MESQVIRLTCGNLGQNIAVNEMPVIHLEEVVINGAKRLARKYFYERPKEIFAGEPIVIEARGDMLRYLSKDRKTPAYALIRVLPEFRTGIVSLSAYDEEIFQNG